MARPCAGRCRFASCRSLVGGCARGGEERGEFVGGGGEVELDGGVGGGGGEGLEQGGELQLGEELAAGGVVGRLGAHRVEGELDRHFGVDGDKFLGEQNVVAIIL